MPDLSKENHPDYLRSIDRLSIADPRNEMFATLGQSGFRTRTIEDQHSAVASLSLHDGVPEKIVVAYETSKNLYLYAWFVYRFHVACRTYVYSCLELALKERFGRELYAQLLAKKAVQENSCRRARRVLKHYDQFHPGLRLLLSYAADKGYLKNECFEEWRTRERVRSSEREIVESIERESGTPIKWEPDEGSDFVRRLIARLPYIRNEFAHGTSALDNSVLGDLRTVSEIINQIYDKPDKRNT